MINSDTSQKDLHAINQLIALTAIMFIFVIGLLAHYLFDLVYKSIESPFFFCQFSCSTTAPAKAAPTPGTLTDQVSDRKDGGAGGDTVAVTTPPTITLNNANAKLVTTAAGTAGECT